MPMRCASSSRWYVGSPRKISDDFAALEVQVRGVFPREPDATVDLDVLGGRVEVRLRAVRLRERGDHRAARRCPRRRPTTRSTRPTCPDSTSSSMSAHLCLIAWNEPIGRPNCTRSLAYCTDMSSTNCAPPIISLASATAAWSSVLLNAGEAVAGAAERLGLDVVELELRLLARHVHRRERRAREPVGVAAHREERDAVGAGRAGRARDDDDEVGGEAVEHEHLLAREREAAASPSVASIVMPADVPLAVRLGERERRDRVAARDAGQQLLLLRRRCRR